MNPLVAFLLRVPLHGLGLLVWPLPRSAELALGAFLGRVARRVDLKRSAIVRDNLRRCFPELNDEAREGLLRRNYEHYGILTLELLHMFTPIPGHWVAYVKRVTRVDGRRNWEAAHDKGKGTLIC